MNSFDYLSPYYDLIMEDNDVGLWSNYVVNSIKRKLNITLDMV